MKILYPRKKFKKGKNDRYQKFGCFSILIQFLKVYFGGYGGWRSPALMAAVAPDGYQQMWITSEHNRYRRMVSERTVLSNSIKLKEGKFKGHKIGRKCTFSTSLLPFLSPVKPK
jgi:hypothetical protein